MNSRYPFRLSLFTVQSRRLSDAFGFALAAVCLFSAGMVLAQQTPMQSEADADRILAKVARDRAAIEEHFKAEEYRCSDQFFANACIDHARERRRIGLNELRAVEVEANAYKRRVQAAERDAAQEEKQVKEQRDLPQRQLKQEATEVKRTEAETKKAPGKPRPAVEASRRSAQHQAKLRQLENDAAADAKKRSENVAAYETKVRAAEEHRKEVEARKLEKERKKAANQAGNGAAPASSVSPLAPAATGAPR